MKIKDNLAPHLTRRLGTTLMSDRSSHLTTTARLDNQPGKLSMHIWKDGGGGGGVGGRHPATHPDQPKVSVLINDNYCLAPVYVT